MVVFPPGAAGWKIPGSPRVGKRLARSAGAVLVVAGLIGISFGSAIAQPSQRYEVRPGDTLSGIAQEYSVSIASLVTLNGIGNPDLIEAGQTIRVGRSGPASGSTFGPLASAPIHAPYISQFDGSVWGPSNCGPTSLAMALGGIGISAQPLDLRALANRQMRNYDPGNGTTWEALAYAAHQRGAVTTGLYQGRYYRQWSTADLQAELSQGHPVLLLVRYRSLPDHLQSRYWGDHYIVALGFNSQGNLIYHDPAFHGDGSYRTMTPAQLSTAWSRTSVGFVRSAMAVEKS